MPENVAMVKCTCGRVYNGAYLSSCPACGAPVAAAHPGESENVALQAPRPDASADVLRAIKRSSEEQTRLLNLIRWSLLGIGVPVIVVCIGLIFGWLSIRVVVP
jgi:hypothetical protein